jgi:hypothetical protein
MREMDFSESNLRNRWLGVKGFWKLCQRKSKMSGFLQIKNVSNSWLQTQFLFVR